MSAATPLVELTTAHAAPETSLATLFKYWPHTTPSAFEIAAAGFRYMDTESHDNVECPSCGLSLFDWQPNHNPWQRHYEEKPYCPFFKQELYIASQYSKAPYRLPLPPSRPTGQIALLQQSTPTPPSKQTTATSSPPPPKKPNHLTIQDLYTRYAPLKNRQATPYKTRTLPTMNMDDLFKKFKKPATETLYVTPPRQQRARPNHHPRAIQKAVTRPDNKPLPPSSRRTDNGRIKSKGNSIQATTVLPTAQPPTRRSLLQRAAAIEALDRLNPSCVRTRSETRLRA